MYYMGINIIEKIKNLENDDERHKELHYWTEYAYEEGKSLEQILAMLKEARKYFSSHSHKKVLDNAIKSMESY